MRKGIAATVVVLAMLACIFAGCKRKEPEEKVIRVMSYNDGLLTFVQTYFDMHPELGYRVEMAYPDYATASIDYEGFLDDMLTGAYETTPDIYVAEAEQTAKYVKGSMASYAATYDELGIPTEQLILESQTAPYAVEVGVRSSDGNVVALPYSSGAGCFIYRRSIAKAVWGTDEPAMIQEKIGGSSGTWEAFWTAAEELKQAGYAVVSGDGDIWYAMNCNMDSDWVVEGELHLSPGREEFLDVSRKLTDNGYSNGTVDWTDAWFADMAGNGEKEVFGFFGPFWLVTCNMSMYYYCGDDPSTAEYEGTYGDWAVCNAPVGFYQGGDWVLAHKDVVDMEKKEVVADILKWMTLDYDENSLQYLLANGLYEPNGGAKEVVVSGKVMENADGSMEFLGGQNMFAYYGEANKQEMELHVTEYDVMIDPVWRNAVREYAKGTKTREEAIAGFKEAVKEKVNLRETEE